MGHCVESFSQLARWPNNNYLVSCVFFFYFFLELCVSIANYSCFCLTIIVFSRMYFIFISTIFYLFVMFSLKYFCRTWLCFYLFFHFNNSFCWATLRKSVIHKCLENLKIPRNRTRKRKLIFSKWMLSIFVHFIA